MPLKVAIMDMEAKLPAVCDLLLQPRRDVLAVGTAARAKGHDVEVYVEILNGVPSARLAEYDVLGAAISGPNFTSNARFFERTRQVNPRVKLVAGGPHASVSPNDVLSFADVAVREEGEITFVELLAAFEANAPIDQIAGISFKRDGRVIHNRRREFLSRPGTVQDLELLTGFRRLSLAGQILKYRGRYIGQVVSSRGCPYPCTFCYENMVGGTGYRKHAIEPLIEDIRRKKEFFKTREFDFADPNFGANPSHSREVLRAIIDADLGCHFTALCRVDIGRHPETLALMKEAGFRSVALGLESLQNPTLASVQKKQTMAEMVESVARIRSFGIEVFGLFMVGFDEDRASTPDSIISFCQEHDVCGMSMYCLTEYPGLPGRTISRRRICELDLDYSGAHFVNTFPKNVRPSVLERGVYSASLRFYSPQQLFASVFGKRRGLAFQSGMFYIMRKLAKVSEVHQRRLEEIEAPYYDSQDRLREDYLREHPVVTEPLGDDILADWVDPYDEIPVKLPVMAVGAAS